MDNSIIERISDGDYDGALDDIANAVRARRKFVARINTLSKRPGDTVVFSDSIRPKYLIGLEAEVVKVNRETIVVNCPDDSRYGRFQNQRGVRCPNSLIA